MVINCIKIDAEIYGMIPNAKIDAFEKAPPTNVSSKPSIPFSVLDASAANLFGSIPGKTMKEPMR